LQASAPGLRIVPIVYYRPALARREIEGKVKAAASAVKASVTLTSAGDGKPVQGAMVVAFTDFQNRAGGQGVTNAQGVVKLAGGMNCVTGEDPQEFGDNGEGHCTHVGGIIAARGTPPHGIRGLAPGVTLRSYRVFGNGAKGASNFAIAKAIDQAVTDHCHLI